VEGAKAESEGGAGEPEGREAPVHHCLQVLLRALPEPQPVHLWLQVFRHFVDEADLIILNRGAHFTNTARCALELRAVSRLLRERYPQKLIFFRNTPPGHANCTDSDRPLEKVQDPGSLPRKYNWKHFLEQNEVARGIAAEFGLLYLDVYSMTKLRADGHRGVTATFIDCLHYCSPGEPTQLQAW